jgi:branched-chain amino acid transport system substrate-binding protein
MKKLSMILSVVVVLALAILLVVTQTKKEPNEIKIGAVLPLTGDGAKYGIGAKEGIDLALDEINSKGGLFGKKVVVIYDDSRLNPADGVAAITKMIDTQKINIIIGDIGSSVTLAMAPIAKQKKAILLSPASSSPKITGIGIFRIWPSDTIEGKIMAEFSKNEMHFNKMAVLYINNDYGVGLKTIFEKTFSDLKGLIILSEAYEQGGTDFRTILTKVKKEKPDAIYFAGYYSEIAVLIRQAKELGIKSKFFSCVGVYEPQFIDLSKGAAEGLIFSAPAYDPKSNNPATVSFVQNFMKKYNREPGIFQAHGYDSLKIIAEAIKKAGGVGSDSIRKALFDIKNYEGATGIMSFDINGDVEKGSRILEVKNGAFIPYKK